MQFNDLLSKEGIDPKDVMVLRHRPGERKLRKVLPWLVDENPKLFNAYQQTQGKRVEKAMQRAKFVASFIGHEAGKALFVGLYKNVGKARSLSFAQFWKMPAYRELKSKYEMLGMTHKHRKCLWFNLVRQEFRAEWLGKLIVSWPGKELSWWRWADRNEFRIHAIADDSMLDHGIPEWKELTLNGDELGTLPRKWRDELSRWRGIYFILDESDGKGYVGAAFGDENLFGRWRAYGKSGHGGNKLMRGRDPKHFRFSVLQIVPHDMEASAVQSLEKSWKDRLHTREFGMNDN